MRRKEHWERVYTTKGEHEVSWFETLPTISPVWIEADVTGVWTLKPMDVWHDRAAFHFLTTPEDRAACLAHMQEILEIHGSAIIATFAPEGPDKCSGLPVARYSRESLAAMLGPSYRLLESRRHVHLTRWGATQAFQYSRLVRLH